MGLGEAHEREENFISKYYELERAHQELDRSFSEEDTPLNEQWIMAREIVYLKYILRVMDKQNISNQ